MARPYEKLADINEKKELWKVAVKVHHKWSVISNNKEHIELIFVDAEGTDVHVIVPTTLKAMFDSVLLVNNTYTVTNFIPQTNDIMFKTSEHPFVIRFTPATRVSEINKHEIPAKKLKLKPFSEIISGNWRKDLLIDVIGLVEDIGYTQMSAGKKQQVNLILKDLGSDTLNCTLWDTYALKFMNFVDMNKDDGPIIILLQYAKLKAEGEYPLSVSNTYNITNLLINEDVSDIVEFRARLPEDIKIGSSSQLMSTQSSMWSQNSGSQITSYDKFMSNASPLCLADILNLPDITWCVTIAKTKKLKATANGWYYQACCKCSKVAKGDAPPFICADGHSTETEIYRYKIEIEVVDKESTAIFVFWDRECTELLEISVAQLRQKMLQAGIEDPLEFPLDLDKLLDIKFAFKVKWQPRWKNASVMSVKRDQETIDRIQQQWDVSKQTSCTEDNDAQIRESVDEAILCEEWNVINDLEITSNLVAQPLIPLPSLEFKTPEKKKLTKEQTVTPTIAGKRGADRGPTDQEGLKELAEGEQSSTRLRCKHVKMENK